MRGDCGVKFCPCARVAPLKGPCCIKCEKFPTNLKGVDKKPMIDFSVRKLEQEHKKFHAAKTAKVAAAAAAASGEGSALGSDALLAAGDLQRGQIRIVRSLPHCHVLSERPCVRRAW